MHLPRHQRVLVAVMILRMIVPATAGEVQIRRDRGLVAAEMKRASQTARKSHLPLGSAATSVRGRQLFNRHW